MKYILMMCLYYHFVICKAQLVQNSKFNICEYHIHTSKY